MEMNKKGFTLVEVLVGLIVLAIGLLAIAGMQIAAIRGNFFSANLTQASVFGQDAMEYLRGLRVPDAVWPAELSLGDHNYGVVPGDDGIIHDSQGQHSIFTRTYRVATSPGIPAASRLLTVTVTWRESVDHSLSYSTIRSPDE